jgi:quercetin dioxygenase-like cupin family protein
MMANRSLLQQLEDDAAMFALGALPADEASKFRERLDSGCALCLTEVHACELTASAIATSVLPVAPPPQLRQRLLDQISQTPAVRSAMEIVRADDSGFVEAPIPGIQIRYLKGKNTFLVRMAPKTHLPAHKHKYNEQCLMLEGSVAGAGQTANAGDFVFMPAGSQHEALYSEEGCLFLITYS